jgi:hypothetical protein
VNLIGDLIKYIQETERLIVVTVALSLSGIVIWWSEREGWFGFDGFPRWVRTVCILVGIVAAMHVVVRSAIAAWKWVLAFPTRHRTALANKVLVDRLLATKGIAREVLSFARHRESDRFWTNTDLEDPDWLRELKRAGLVQFIDAGFRGANSNYRIHRVAWDYIKRRPNKFICKVPWEAPPWTQRFDDERRMNKILENAGT